MHTSSAQTDSYRISHSSVGYGLQYSRVYQEGYYFHQWNKLEKPLLTRILNSYKRQGATRVMDFACGTGRILSVLEKHFPNPTGVDVSETMLGFAKSQCKKSQILQQDITSDPIDGEFDLVTAFRFFLNAEEPLKVDALKAIHLNLADNGVLIANIHQNSSSPLGMAHKLRNLTSRSKRSNDLGYKEFETILNSCGFRVVELHRYSFLPRPGWLATNFLGRIILPFEQACTFLRLPRFLCQSFIIVAEKR